MEVTVYFDNSTLLHFNTYVHSLALKRVLSLVSQEFFLSYTSCIAHTVRYFSHTCMSFLVKIVHFSRVLVSPHISSKHSHSSKRYSIRNVQNSHTKIFFSLSAWGKCVWLKRQSSVRCTHNTVQVDLRGNLM